MSATKEPSHSPKHHKSPRNLITRTNAERQEDFTARRLHEIRELIPVPSPRNSDLAHVAYSEQTPRNPLLTGRSLIENTPRKLTLPSEVDSDPKSLE